MEKVLAILCPLVLAACSLTACGNNDNNKTDVNSTTISQPAAQTEVPTEAPVEDAPAYVGTWVFDPSSSTNDFAVEGVLELNADNTFALTSTTRSNKTEVEAGVYTVNGSTLSLTLTHYTERDGDTITSDEDIPDGSTLDGTIDDSRIVIGTGNNTATFVKQ